MALMNSTLFLTPLCADTRRIIRGDVGLAQIVPEAELPGNHRVDAQG